MITQAILIDKESRRLISSLPIPWQNKPKEIIMQPSILFPSLIYVSEFYLLFIAHLP